MGSGRLSPSPEGIQAVADAVLRGEVSTKTINRWTELFWERGGFFHTVDVRAFQKQELEGALVRRYAGTKDVAHRVTFGAKGRAGCVVVRAPRERDSYQGDLNDLLVPPHTHPTAHIAIVFGGGGTFVAKRAIDEVNHIVMIPASPGSIFFYPAHIPHTFVSGKQGIQVASAQAEFESPKSAEFARLSTQDLNALPRMEQAEYESSLEL